MKRLTRLSSVATTTWCTRLRREDEMKRSCKFQRRREKLARRPPMSVCESVHLADTLTGEEEPTRLSNAR